MTERISSAPSARGYRFTHVIVGASAAGLAAVEAIRETERRQSRPPSSVAVIAEEPYPPYARHLISYYLTGERVGDALRYRPAEYFSRLHAQGWLGWRVVSVDARRQVVTVEPVATPQALPGAGPLRDPGVVGVDPALPLPRRSPVEIAYDQLLLATGGEPIRPRLDDPDLATPPRDPDRSGLFSFTTLADAVQLRRALTAGRVQQVVVVGGGLIGLQVAEALTRLPTPMRPADIAIVELLPRLLTPVLDEEGSQRVQERAEAAGVRVFTGKAAAALRRDSQGRLEALQLASGEVLPAQAIILAVGVRPRTDLARQVGLVCGRGITLRDGAQTSSAGIFAAGDVAEGWDLAAQQQRPLPIWSNAAWQGHWAGRQMAEAAAGGDGARQEEAPPAQLQPVPGLMLNAAHFFGLTVVSAGVHQPPSGQEGEYQILSRSRQLPAVPPAMETRSAEGDACAGSGAGQTAGQRGESLNLSRNGRPLPDRTPTAVLLAAGGWDYRKLVFHKGRLVGMMAAGPSVAGAGFISGLIRQSARVAPFGPGLLERWDVTALPRPLRQRWLWGEIGLASDETGFAEAATAARGVGRA